MFASAHFGFDLCARLCHIGGMRDTFIKIKVSKEEKRAFEVCSWLFGQNLSVWVRQHLRRQAVKELTEVGKPVPFLEEE